jgi:glyoxylate/hydroxypyruvate reductase A
MPDAVCVLVASPIEPGLVARIGAVNPRVSVLYAPDLMPEPRYPAGHTGAPRPLSPADVDRWSRLRAQADISFDFDWHDPGQEPAQLPAASVPRRGRERADHGLVLRQPEALAVRPAAAQCL